MFYVARSSRGPARSTPTSVVYRLTPAARGWCVGVCRVLVLAAVPPPLKATDGSVRLFRFLLPPCVSSVACCACVDREHAAYLARLETTDAHPYLDLACCLLPVLLFGHAFVVNAQGTSRERSPAATTSCRPSGGGPGRPTWLSPYRGSRSPRRSSSTSARRASWRWVKGARNQCE